MESLCVHATACPLYSRMCEWNSLVAGMRRIENNNAHESDSKQCSFIHEQEIKQEYMNVFISSKSR